MMAKWTAGRLFYTQPIFWDKSTTSNWVTLLIVGIAVFFGFNESGIWESLGWSKSIRYCYKARGVQGKEEIIPKPGDLLFFHNNEGRKVRELPGHVAISLGGQNAMSLFFSTK